MWSAGGEKESVRAAGEAARSSAAGDLASSGITRCSRAPPGTRIPMEQRGQNPASAAAASDAALLELARASGLELSPDMLAVVLELLHLDVTPQGLVSLLRSIKDAKLKAAATSSQARVAAAAAT